MKFKVALKESKNNFSGKEGEKKNKILTVKGYKSSGEASQTRFDDNTIDFYEYFLEDEDGFIYRTDKIETKENKNYKEGQKLEVSFTIDKNRVFKSGDKQTSKWNNKPISLIKNIKIK